MLLWFLCLFQKLKKLSLYNWRSSATTRKTIRVTYSSGRSPQMNMKTMRVLGLFMKFLTSKINVSSSVKHIVVEETWAKRSPECPRLPIYRQLEFLSILFPSPQVFWVVSYRCGTRQRDFLTWINSSWMHLHKCSSDTQRAYNLVRIR